MKRVIFVNHGASQCGVYQFGKSTASVLVGIAEKYSFEYLECRNREEMEGALSQRAPAAVILNHHASTMPWFNGSITLRFPAVHFLLMVHDARYDFPGIVGIIHPDPTFEESGRDFKVGRLVPAPPTGISVIPDSVSTFGLSAVPKGLHYIVDKVNREFDSGVLRLHMPVATYGDPSGLKSAEAVAMCRAHVKPAIHLVATTGYMSETQLLEWLAASSINVFNYADSGGLGISSAIDWALGARRPLAVSGSRMFRHILDDSIRLDQNSLKDIVARGTTPMEPYVRAWTAENLVRDYERILDAVVN